MADKIPRVDAREIDAFFVCMGANKKPIFLIHIEYQVDDDPTMLRRMQQYQSRILLQIETNPALKWMAGLPMKSFVIYVGLKESKMRKKVSSDQVFVGFDLIELREIPYNEFLKSNQPEIVTLAVLGDFQNKDKKTVATEITNDLKNKTAGNSFLFEKSLRNLHNFSNLRSSGLNKIIKKLTDKIMIKIDEKKDLFYLKGKEDQTKFAAFNLLSDGVRPDLIKKYLGISNEIYKKIEKEWKAQQSKKEE